MRRLFVLAYLVASILAPDVALSQDVTTAPSVIAIPAPASQVPSPASTQSSSLEMPPSSETVPVQIVDQMMLPLNDRLRYAACVSFLNASQKLITAVRFDFNMINAFHESVSHFHGDRIGEFSPGVTIAGPANVGQYNTGVNGGSMGGANQKIKNCWYYYLSGGIPQSMQASVVHVIFADGTEWMLRKTSP